MSDISDACELERLREYVAEYRKMIREHDSMLPRWRHYQTQWLWLYLRGMIGTEHPEDVRQRRLAELEVARTPADSEGISALERQVAADKSRVISFAKIEMVGGPADGQVQFVSLPIADARVATAKSMNGRVVKPLYRRRSGEIGDVVSLRVRNVELKVADSVLEKAFAGKRTTKFVFAASG